MLAYREAMRKLIDVLEGCVRSNKIAGDFEKYDWKNKISINHNGIHHIESVLSNAPSKFGAMHPDTTITINVAKGLGKLHLHWDSVIQLQQACPGVKLIFERVDRCSNMDFSTLTNVEFEYPGDLTFVKCKCITTQAIFTTTTSENDLTFNNCEVSDEFFTLLNITILRYYFSVGMINCKNLPNLLIFLIEGDQEQHFPKSFSGVPPKINQLNITLGEDHEVKQIACMHDMYTFFSEIKVVRITMSIDIPMPLLNFMLIKVNNFRLESEGDDSLADQCGQVIREACSSRKLAGTTYTLQDVQEDLIEMGGIDYARL